MALRIEDGTLCDKRGNRQQGTGIVAAAFVNILRQPPHSGHLLSTGPHPSRASRDPPSPKGKAFGKRQLWRPYGRVGTQRTVPCAQSTGPHPSRASRDPPSPKGKAFGRRQLWHPTARLEHREPSPVRIVAAAFVYIHRQPPHSDRGGWMVSV